MGENSYTKNEERKSGFKFRFRQCFDLFCANETFVAGDRKYGIPPLDPFLVSEITVPTGAITLRVQDAKVNGMKDVELKKIQCLTFIKN